MKDVLKSIFFIINIILFITFIFTLLFISFIPPIFCISTFILSVFMFSRIEYEKTLHERAFYSNREPGKIHLFVLGIWVKFQVLIQSAILSLWSVFLFSGTNSDRTTKIDLFFILLVILGYFILYPLQKRHHINIERWGYIKISILFGAAFSLLLSNVEGLNIWDIGKSIIKEKSSGLDFNEIAELLYGLLAQFEDVLESIFTKIFGEFLGKVISQLFTLNTTFGFVIYVYVIQYLRFQNNYRDFVERMTSTK